MFLCVCYEDYGFEGNSKPLAVFDEPKQAARWCRQRSIAAYYVVLELNNIEGLSTEE